MTQHELLTQEELGKVVAEVSQKAAVDADFRQKFIVDAKSVIGEITGKELPSDAVIDVIDSRPEVMATYVVPALNADAPVQLSPLVLSDQSEWTSEDYQATVNYVLNKSGIDACFRKDFLANPYAVVEKQTGKKIPEGFRFDIREARPEAALTFALSKYVGENGLTDEELLMINAAGSNPVKAVVSVVGSALNKTAEVIVDINWKIADAASNLIKKIFG